ncbi:MAG: phosphatase PAP2 family protein [Myxococcota bacterium]
MKPLPMLRRVVDFLRQPAVWRYVVGPLPFLIMLSALVGKRFTFEHAVVPGVMAVLYFLPFTRRAYPYLFPFFFFWATYDTLRVFTPIFHNLHPPLVAGPYLVEKFLFGIPAAAGRITLNEFFATHTSTFVDLLAAFAYAAYFYEPFIFAFYLLAKDRPLLRRYGLAFLVTNYLGFITYYTLPAAPPWYVELYGLGAADLATPPNPARLAAVDELLGVTYFHDLYSKSANVFGALPSLHAAFPLLVWLYARKAVRPIYHWPLFAYWLLVCFSAVYLRHHYVIDVALGSLYAGFAYWLIERIAKAWGFVTSSAESSSQPS